MTPVAAPIDLGSAGLEVENLQDALLALIAVGRLPGVSGTGATTAEVTTAVNRDRQRSRYGPGTADAVRRFQEAMGLNQTGDVDEATALALNELLMASGLLDTPGASRAVSGTVTVNGEPAGGVIVVATVTTLDGSKIRVGETSTTGDGTFTLWYAWVQPAVPRLEVTFAAPGAEAQAMGFDGPGQITIANVDLFAPLPARTVSAALRVKTGEIAAGVTVRLAEHTFNGLVGHDEAVTDSRGLVRLTYRSAVLSPALRLFVSSGGNDIEVADVSRGRTALAEDTPLPVVIPREAVPLEAEFKVLTADVTAAAGGLDVAMFEEHDTKRQLTALSTATGWDARLIALATLSAQMADDVDLGLDSANRAAFYGAARAGLPATADLLAEVHPAEFVAAVSLAAKAGVVDVDPASFDGIRSRFSDWAAKQLSGRQVPGGSGSYDDFLASPLLAGLTPAEQQTLLREVLHGETATPLFERLAAHLALDEVAKIRLHGRLAYATGFSAKIADALYADHLDQPDSAFGPQLVAKGLHEPGGWRQAALAAIGTDATKFNPAVDGPQLLAALPPAFGDQGGDPNDALQAYAEFSARRVRLTYPTLVLAADLEADKAALEAAAAQHVAGLDGLVAALKQLSNEGEQLAGTHAEVVERMTAVSGALSAETEAALRQVRVLQQFSPTNKTLTALWRLGVTSAADIAGISLEQFHNQFSATIHDMQVRALTYRRARQVTTVTRTLFTTLVGNELDPETFGTSGTADTAASDQSGFSGTVNDLYPDIEGLFGDLDFCACDQCQSLIGPAAYFVDLLEFINEKDAQWGRIVADWEAKTGKKYAPDHVKPFKALTARRPDLANIPLTCDNSNTLMPNIDIVNEILEYITAGDGQLREDAARDTDGRPSAELLVEPDYVNDEAYRKLGEQRYPLNLPFDQPLESCREFARLLRVTLSQIAAAVASPTVELSLTAIRVNQATAALEQLGVTPREVEVATSATLDTDWKALYGFTAADDDDKTLKFLSNAANLADRLDVTYLELADIVSSRFVNPALDKLRIVEHLHLNVSEVVEFLDNLTEFKKFEGGKSHKLDAALLNRLVMVRRRLDALNTTFETVGFDAEKRLVALKTAKVFSDAVLINDMSVGCDFTKAELKTGAGPEVDAEVLVRLNLFVRLWRRLGRPIGEVDTILAALTPSGAPLDTAHYADRPLTSTLVLAGQMQQLRTEPGLTSLSAAQALVLWGDVDARGPASLYGRLFLKPAVAGPDQVFTSPLGEYLSDAAVASHRAAHRFVASLGGVDEAGQLDPTVVDEADRSVVADYDSVLGVQRLTFINPTNARLDQIAGKLPAGSNPHATYVKLRAELESLRDGYDKLAAHLPALQAATGLTAADTAMVVADAFDTAVDATKLDMASVSALLRYRLLSKGCQLSVGDLITFKQLLSDTFTLAPKVAGGAATPTAQPFAVLPSAVLQDGDVTPPAQTRNFVRRLRQLRSAGLSAPESNYLLRGEDVSFERDLDAQLANLGKAIAAAQLEAKALASFPTGASPTENGARAADALARLFDAADAQWLVELMLPRPTSASQLPPPKPPADETEEQKKEREKQEKAAKANKAREDQAAAEKKEKDDKARFASVFVAQQFAGAPFLPTDAYDKLRERPAGGPNNELAAAQLRDAQFQLLAAALKPALNFAAIAAAVATTLNLAQPVVELALGWRLAADGNNKRTLVVNALRQDPTSDATKFKQAVVLLRKLALLVERLGLDATQLGLLEQTAEHRQLFADQHLEDVLSGARVSSTDPADQRRALIAVRAEFLCRLAQYCNLRDRPTVGVLAAAELVNGLAAGIVAVGGGGGGANSVEWAKQVAMVLALAADVPLEAAAAATGAAPSSAFPPVVSFDAAENAVDLLGLSRSAGATPAQLVEWATVLLPASNTAARAHVAHSMRVAANVKIGEDAWAATAKPAFDRLRKRQRDALVAYCLRVRNLTKVERLYDELLLDPEMEPAVLTSRLRLAIGSVQLFIQRVLLNMEKQVPPGVIDAKQWVWMKQYSVWAANRKIFLHPADYLEPEFRDDKSDLFKELESTLLQSDVSGDVVDAAMSTYLTKLTGRSKIAVLGCHIEHTSGGRRVLHVVGRTANPPREFLYRRYENGIWSPWELINADMSSDLAVPVVWQSRLHLFWLTVHTRGGDTTKVPEQSPEDRADAKKAEREVAVSTTTELMNNTTARFEAAQTWKAELHLNWTAYVSGEWQPAQMHIPGPEDDEKLGLANLTNADRDNLLARYMVAVEIVPTEIKTDAKEVLSPQEIQRRRSTWPLRDELRLHLVPPDGIKPVYFSFATPRSTPAVTSGVAAPAAMAEPIANYRRNVRGFTRRWDKLPDGTNGPVGQPLAITVHVREKVGPDPGKPIDVVVLREEPAGLLRLIIPTDFVDTEAGSVERLVRPFFVEDPSATTFFEPTVVERTFEEYEQWVVSLTIPVKTKYVETINLDKVFEPIKQFPYNPDLPPLPDPYPDLWRIGARVNTSLGFDRSPIVDPPQTVRYADPVVNRGTVVLFNKTLVGERGALLVDKLKWSDVVPTIEKTTPTIVGNRRLSQLLGLGDEEIVVMKDVGLKVGVGGQVFVHGLDSMRQIDVSAGEVLQRFDVGGVR